MLVLFTAVFIDSFVVCVILVLCCALRFSYFGCYCVVDWLLWWAIDVVGGGVMRLCCLWGVCWVVAFACVVRFVWVWVWHGARGVSLDLCLLWLISFVNSVGLLYAI